MDATLDLTATRFVLPADAKLLAVQELAPRLRAKIGPIAGNQVVVTRPGFRVTTRLVTSQLADLLSEFRSASLITDAVMRFSKNHEQDALEMLELSFDALATFIDGRILVADNSADAQAAEPSLAAGQAVDGMEIEHLVRALDDTEVYRVRLADGSAAALKIARDSRAQATLLSEAELLMRLAGGDTPLFLAEGRYENRQWLAMEWREGVSIAVAAQQARAAGDRSQLQQLTSRLLAAYSRLHARDIVHGDIHTGNVLVDALGNITILDFGRARLTTQAMWVDPNRAGIAHYYDPQLAGALLAGQLSPAVSKLSEQYALGVLVYLLLTGRFPFDPVAEHTALLQRIVAQPMLVFAARGVDAWPQVESVLRQALAKDETQRHPSTTAFAEAFRNSAGSRQRLRKTPPDVAQLISTLNLNGALSNEPPHYLAWLALRGALACSDAELLALADLWVTRSDNSLGACSVAIAVARARSDHRAERDATTRYLAAAEGLNESSARFHALIDAAQVLDHSAAAGSEQDKLYHWIKSSMDSQPLLNADPAQLHALLALNRAGAIALPAQLQQQLDLLSGGSVWLWSMAYEVLHQPDYLQRALTATLPSEPLFRGLAYLRLHQLTGETRWVAAARRLSNRYPPATAGFKSHLLAIELQMPARAITPPWVG